MRCARPGAVPNALPRRGFTCLRDGACPWARTGACRAAVTRRTSGRDASERPGAGRPNRAPAARGAARLRPAAPPEVRSRPGRARRGRRPPPRPAARVPRIADRFPTPRPAARPRRSTRSHESATRRRGTAADARRRRRDDEDAPRTTTRTAFPRATPTTSATTTRSSTTPSARRRRGRARAVVYCPTAASRARWPSTRAAGAHQEYVEELPVCCRPWRVTVATATTARRRVGPDRRRVAAEHPTACPTPTA
jgi:hypothetical protein